MYSVEIDDSERPNAGSREVVERGGAQASGSDHEDGCVSQPLLTFLADFRKPDLAGVSI